MEHDRAPALPSPAVTLGTAQTAETPTWADSTIAYGWSNVITVKCGATSRTVDAIYQAISQALDTITSDNAIGFFRHAGISIP